MKFSSLLHKQFIKVNHKVESSQQLIKEMVKEVCREFTPEFEHKVVDIILKREAESSTASNNIAIPHARVPDFSDLIIAISIPDKPIMVNNHEVKIFFLIITAETSAIYLNVLSAIARMASDEKIITKILESKKPDEVVKAIDATGINIKDDYVVKDIMDKNFPKISYSSTLKEGIDSLLRENSLFAVVLKDGQLVGELTLCNIIEKMMPSYVKSLISLEFLKTSEPIEELLNDEDKIPIGQVMAPVEIEIHPDDSIIGAVLMMVKENRSFIPVVDENKPVGVVTLKNFVEKVLRA